MSPLSGSFCIVKDLVLTLTRGEYKILFRKLNMHENRLKVAVIGILLALCIFSTFYFYLVLHTEVVFTHFFYIPIILTAVWFPRKAIFVAILLAAITLLMSFLTPFSCSMHSFIRAVMFIVVAIFSDELCYRKEKACKEEFKSREQMLHSEKLSTIGRLVTAVMHEIDKPVTIIDDAVKTMLSKTDKESSHYANLRIMEENINKIKGLAKHIQIFTIKTEPKLTSLNVEVVITNALALIGEELKDSNITVSTHFEPDLPYIRGDSQQVEKIILSIIDNAHEAMKEKEREVGEYKKELGINVYPENNFVDISISDTGGGIPKEIKDKIFEPLFTTKKEALGLGLSMCKRIVEKHKGLLQVKSSDMGATFIIKLPVSS